MTNSMDRLDRIEALLERMAEEQASYQQQSRVELSEVRSLVSSNARAAEANSNAIAELRASLTETRAGIDDAVEMITAISRESAEERQELSQQIQVLVDESRQNTREHEDFRSFVRGLQMEVRRIWERITGNGEAGEA
jgi:chromosome segregation ATPase